MNGNWQKKRKGYQVTTECSTWTLRHIRFPIHPYSLLCYDDDGKNGSKERISFETTTRTVEAVTSVSDFFQKRTCYQLLFSILYAADADSTPPPSACPHAEKKADVSDTISVVFVFFDFIFNWYILLNVDDPLFNQHVFRLLRAPDRLTPTLYTSQRMWSMPLNWRIINVI